LDGVTEKKNPRAFLVNGRGKEGGLSCGLERGILLAPESRRGTVTLLEAVPRKKRGGLASLREKGRDTYFKGYQQSHGGGERGGKLSGRRLFGRGVSCLGRPAGPAMGGETFGSRQKREKENQLQRRTCRREIRGFM